MKKTILYVSLLGILLACSTVPLTGRKQFVLFSDEEVLASSLQLFNEFMQEASLSTNHANTQMVERCGGRIAYAVENYLREKGFEDQLHYFKWEFKLVKSSEVNAICLPGGKIVVYEGILPYAKDEHGLAVVLGHEIAHAVARHGNERMSQEVLSALGGALLNEALAGESEALQTICAVAYGLGAEVGVMLPFSRKHEYEADRMGTIFMAMAGYDPYASVRFWQDIRADKGPDPLAFLSTHPTDAKRIEALKLVIPEALNYQQTGNQTISPSINPMKTTNENITSDRQYENRNNPPARRSSQNSQVNQKIGPARDR